jgi:hypothetical protein
MTAIVRQSVIEVRTALRELGLESDILREAILRGEVARDSCTANDPPSAPGFDAWARTVRALREILIPRGWSRNDDINLSTIVSPNGSFAITVATGDEGTGRVEADPKTKYPKGPATEAAVNRNQLRLFAVDESTAEMQLTWMLLRRRDGESVLSELSLPASMTEDGQVEEWLERIILDPITLGPDLIIRGTPEPSAPPIDIPVRRRS